MQNSAPPSTRCASSRATPSRSNRIDEVTVKGTLVSDLGLDPGIWLFLSFLGCITLFFKFSRVWSVRNLDLLLLFVLVPGMMLIVEDQAHHPWSAYVWLFLGSALWLVRCLLDLGLSRRPLLEPNLNAPGLACLSAGGVGVVVGGGVGPAPGGGGGRHPARQPPPPAPAGRQAPAAAPPGPPRPP